MSQKRIPTLEVLASALMNPTLQLEVFLPLSVPLIVSVMGQTQKAAPSTEYICIVLNQNMYEQILALAEIACLFEPTLVEEIIAAGQMGTLLGMDVLVSEKVLNDCFSIVVLSFNDTLVSTSMRIRK